MRIFQNFSILEKALLAGIFGYMAFLFGQRLANSPVQYYHFPDRNLEVVSLMMPDGDNCPNDDISRNVYQQQIEPKKLLARYLDCGNKGFLTDADRYADFYRCFYIFQSRFQQIKNCQISVANPSLSIGVEMAKANRDYQELLNLMGE